MADLSGCNLLRANLRGVVLTNTDLTGATLADADLREANLSRARLLGADLSNADLSGANLEYAKLRGAILTGANMTGANCRHANLLFARLSYTRLAKANLHRAYLKFARLKRASLSGANLWTADLSDANLSYADMTRANLRESILTGAIFATTQLDEANLSQATLGDTTFADTDLSKVIGLETCDHRGASAVDYQTLQQSGPLPLTFLRGVGLPDMMISYLPSLLGQAIQHYSCFISYSGKDQNFAERLSADLQNKGVRCWFAPHDMPIGGKILDEIDAAIRLREKLLLILSEHAIASDWVEDEATKAFEEERRRGQTVLFPIRLDDAVLDTNEAWAAKLRARHIGDFRRWKDHDAYTKAFERVLRDLTVKKDAAP